MDPKSFTSSDRGTVQKTLTGYWAFHPKPLPRRIDLPADIVLLLEQATGAVYRLDGLGQLLPNPHLLIRPYLNLEAVLSSRIEGTRTDVTQLLRHEAGDRPKDSREADDAQEVTNYVIALEHGIRRTRDGFPMSIRLLREMHRLLLAGVRGVHRCPGELRKSPVWIGGSTLENAVFVPPPPDPAHDALTDLEKFLHSEEMPVLVQLALAHYQFEVIHPFLDGNGRIGRLMIPVMLSVRGVLHQPLLYLSGFFERHRSLYYDLLLRTSQTGDLMPWLSFFLEGVRDQARDSVERTKRLVKLRRQLRDRAREQGLPRSATQLAESLATKPVVSAASVAQSQSVSRPTAHSAINALVELGVLREITGRKRSRLYAAPQVMDVVFGEKLVLEGAG